MEKQGSPMTSAHVIYTVYTGFRESEDGHKEIKRKKISDEREKEKEEGNITERRRERMRK